VPIGGEVTGADRAFMLEPPGPPADAGDKIRDGVVRLFTMRNAFGTVSFAVERSDGTTDDFSIGTCVKGLAKT
jgi:hypothetical protein